MSFLTTGINLDQLADSGSIPNGYLLAYNATTKRFEPVAPPSGGGGGTCIANGPGSVCVNASGNQVISGRVDSIGGLVTGPDTLGMPATRIAAGFTYAGSDIGGPAPAIGRHFSSPPGPSGGAKLPFNPQVGTVDSTSWDDSDWWVQVQTPGSVQPGAKLRLHTAWMAPNGRIIEDDLLIDFDITVENIAQADLGCKPHKGSTPAISSYGIWYWITGDGSVHFTDPSNPPVVIFYSHLVQH